MTDRLTDKLLFAAVLRPHRSLSRSGLIAVMAIIAGMSFITGVVFALIGAWPVLGFLGLDVLAVFWALRANQRHGRLRETIEVSDHEVILRRLAPSRPVDEIRFTRSWIALELEENPQTGIIGRLSLISRGRRHYFGDFLSGEERKSLARELTRTARLRRA